MPSNPTQSNLIIHRKQDLPPAAAVSLLYWGPAKSGKTHFALTAGDRSLFISNGMGRMTAEHEQFKNLNNFIIDIPYDDIGNKERSFDMVENAITLGLTQLVDQIDTIIVDDASSQTRSGYVKALEFNQSIGKSQTLEKIKGGRIQEIAMMPGDYGTEMDMSMQFWAWAISECKQHNKHFILLAHERNVFAAPKKIGDQPTLIKQTPAFTGADKNPDRIPGLFDWVMHAEVQNESGKNVFYARTKGSNSMMAGVRGKAVNIFEDKIKNPNFLQMIERVRAA